MELKLIKHIIKHKIRSITLKDFPLRLKTWLYSNLVRPSYKMAFKMIKHIIKDIIRSITLKDIPIRITTVLYSTLLRPSYQMALKTIKKIITDTIRSITLKSIIKNLKNKFITKSKHEQNINLVKYRIFAHTKKTDYLTNI